MMSIKLSNTCTVCCSWRYMPNNSPLQINKSYVRSLSKNCSCCYPKSSKNYIQVAIEWKYFRKYLQIPSKRSKCTFKVLGTYSKRLPTGKNQTVNHIILQKFIKRRSLPRNNLKFQQAHHYDKCKNNRKGHENWKLLIIENYMKT